MKEIKEKDPEAMNLRDNKVKGHMWGIGERKWENVGIVDYYILNNYTIW